jgi:glycosyltransferase involved in cell wall biosynthesis
MSRIVCISPNAIENDSRTFKFAASAARLGYEAVVVESERSQGATDSLPFELVSPPLAERSPNEVPIDGAEPTAPETPGTARRLLDRVAAVLRLLVRPLRGPLFILRANVGDYVRRNRTMAAMLPAADVYWLFSFWNFPATYLKARRGRARFLYDAPDSHWEPGEWAAEDRTSRSIIRAHEWLESRCARRAERFTTVGEGVASLMEARFGRRPDVIRNSHDFRMDEDCELDIREQAGVSREDFLLVMSGNLKPGTAVAESLLALNRLPEHVHLAFLAPGAAVPDEVLERIERHPRAHRLAGVPPSEVVSFMSKADASPLLYRAGHSLNLEHALPNGFFQAVAAGLPILFPPLPEMRALAQENELGIEIDTADPESIADGIRTLVSHPELTSRYRANAQRAREVVSWERDEEKLAQMLGPAGSG